MGMYCAPTFFPYVASMLLLVHVVRDLQPSRHAAVEFLEPGRAGDMAEVRPAGAAVLSYENGFTARNVKPLLAETSRRESVLPPSSSFENEHDAPGSQGFPSIEMLNGGSLFGVDCSPVALACSVKPVPVYPLVRVGNVATPCWNVVDVSPPKLPHDEPQSKSRPSG